MDKTYIIAEAGVNHNGNYELAKQMIEKAKESGADAVKFQTFIPKNLVSRFAKKAEYQKAATGEGETQKGMLEKLALSFDQFILLNEYSKTVGIDFLSTPFDEESIDFLSTLSMSFWKIPSGEITNKPYLIKIKNTKKPIILSTGMSTLSEIKAAMDVFIEYPRGDITLLHCNTEYPTPYKDVNLRAMITLREKFGVKVGFSDHTAGIHIPVAAAAMGATIVEKHFTLDRNMMGPDHKASLEPEELKNMIRHIRDIEIALGDGEKIPTNSEQKNINIVRKSIVAKKSIKMGENFNETNITVKRPGDGINPMNWFEVIGKTAPRDFQEDELIEI